MKQTAPQGNILAGEVTMGMKGQRPHFSRPQHMSGQLSLVISSFNQQ